MAMNKRWVSWRLLAIAVLLTSSATAFAQADLTNHKVDSNKIVQQAKDSSYSLSERGLSELRCDVEPDWDSTFASTKTAASFREQVLPLLKAMRFQAVVGGTGVAAVSHQLDAAPADQSVADRVRDAANGFEQIVDGFFESWSQFMVNSPLPEPDGKYSFEARDGAYYLSLKQGSDDVDIVMSHDLTITETKVAGREVNGTIDPHFIKRQDKLVLDSYDAEPSSSQKLDVSVRYQEVRGLLLPELVEASMRLSDSAVKFPIRFSGCRVKLSSH